MPGSGLQEPRLVRGPSHRRKGGVRKTPGCAPRGPLQRAMLLCPGLHAPRDLWCQRTAADFMLTARIHGNRACEPSCSSLSLGVCSSGRGARGGPGGGREGGSAPVPQTSCVWRPSRTPCLLPCAQTTGRLPLRCQTVQLFWMPAAALIWTPKGKSAVLLPASASRFCVTSTSPAAAREHGKRLARQLQIARRAFCF